MTQEPREPRGGSSPLPATGSTDQPTERTPDRSGEREGRRDDRLEVRGGRSSATWIVLVLVGIGLAILGWFTATSFVPRWWAHRIGNVSDGSFTAGISAGLALGVVFTALPLLALRGVFGWRRSWRARLAWLVAAVVLAGPNLVTLGIVLGNGGAAHAADRTLDVEAPGFRGATLVGAFVGTCLAVALWLLLWGRRRRSAEIVRLRAQLGARDTPPQA